jgi:antitoxin component HigA of HigAB toxin-antitoxin module
MISIQQTLTTWAKLHQTVHPPETEQQYAALLEFVNTLTNEKDISTEPVQSLFLLACQYLKTWEDNNEPPVPDSSPLEHLRALMTERGTSQYQLQKAGVAKQPVISRVLSGERQISKELAKKLSAFFQVPYKIFL